MKVYHSSYCIIQSPDIRFSRDKLDFGKGFYVTTLEEQAEKWGEKFTRKHQDSFVNEYDFDDSILANPDIRIKSFTQYDEEWLDYVFACRQGELIYQQFDIVMGGVANDKIFATIDAFFAGYMSKEMALSKLKYEKPNQQMCFLSQKVLNETLTFLNAKRL